MSQRQIMAMLANKAKDARHAHRMATDPAYRAKVEREEREYEEFIAIHGEAPREPARP